MAKDGKTSRNLAFATVALALTAASYYYWPSISPTLASLYPFQNKSGITPSPVMARKFAEFWVVNALDRYIAESPDYKGSARDSGKFADADAWHQFRETFRVAPDRCSRAVFFVPSEFAQPELQKDGNVKVRMAGDLIAQGDSKLDAQSFALDLIVRRDEDGYRIQSYSLASATADNISDFLDRVPHLPTTEPNRQASLHYLSAMQSRQKLNYVRALQSLDTAISCNPDFALAYRQRAFVRRELGDKRGARLDLNHCIVLKPDDWCAYLDRAELKDQTPRAILADYNQSIKLCPTNSAAYLKRAASYPDSLYSRAMEDCGKYIALQPKDTGGYFYRATLRYEHHDYVGSMLDCNKAIELDDNNESAYDLRSSLRRLCFDFYGAEQDRLAAANLNQLRIYNKTR